MVKESAFKSMQSNYFDLNTGILFYNKVVKIQIKINYLNPFVTREVISKTLISMKKLNCTITLHRSLDKIKDLLIYFKLQTIIVK